MRIFPLLVTGLTLCMAMAGITPAGAPASVSPIVADTASAPTAENCVPANGVVDPAETVTVDFSLSNTGGGATTNLVATLQNGGGVTPVTLTQNYGVIAAAGNASRAFTFTASGTCGRTITATFQLQDGAINYGTVAFIIRLGVPKPGTVVLQNFDGVTAPTPTPSPTPAPSPTPVPGATPTPTPTPPPTLPLPAGWTGIIAAGTPVKWATSTTSSDSAPNSGFATPTSTVSDNRLESPRFAVAATNAQISFKHRWNTETGYDGGVLEISIGGGAFADIVTAGGSFVTGGYTGPISTGYSSPIAGRQAWTGDANGSYTTTTVNLPASAAGLNVRLRFRLACDSSFVPTSPVWRIDSITLTDTTYTCCGAAPLFTSAPPANGTVDVPSTHTFTTSGTPPPTFTVTAGTLPAVSPASPSPPQTASLQMQRRPSASRSQTRLNISWPPSASSARMRSPPRIPITTAS